MGCGYTAQGYGISSYGTMPYGQGDNAALFIVSAIATSERSFIVELSKAPGASSTIGTGDALNPQTWTLIRQDTGEEFVILAITPTDQDRCFEFFVLEKLGSAGVTHRISSSNLVDGNGQLITAPEFFDFKGVVFVPSTKTRGLVDIANPPVPGVGDSGGWSVDSSGNYELESGIPLYKKLILRRLSTIPGGFFHLPEYGFGIRLKEPVLTSDLPKLQNAIQRALFEEPEFSSVKVRLTLDTSGVLTITVRVELQSNSQVISMAIPVSPSTVEL